MRIKLYAVKYTCLLTLFMKLSFFIVNANLQFQFLHSSQWQSRLLFSCLLTDGKWEMESSIFNNRRLIYSFANNNGLTEKFMNIYTLYVLAYHYHWQGHKYDVLCEWLALNTELDSLEYEIYFMFWISYLECPDIYIAQCTIYDCITTGQASLIVVADA